MICFWGMDMTVLPLLAVGILMNFVAVLFLLVCLILILVVLMQKGRGGGLSGAFGGGMATGLLGSKTGDFLTWVTVVLVSIFLFLAVIMARYYRSGTKYGRTPTTTTQQPAPPAGTAQPSTPAEQPAPTAPAPAPQSGPAQPPAPASQPSTTQPSTSGASSTPAPAPDTGKSGG
jgi:preprotein translocase subunit SecG